MFKRLISILLILLMIMPASLTFAQKDEVPVYLDGEKIVFDQNPIIENDRTLVPLRKIFESLGATVNYDEANEVVSGEKDGIAISLKIGEDKAIVDGKEVALDVPAKVVNSRTLVPLRFISEAFGDHVEWDDKNGRIFITKNMRAKKAPELGEIPTADDVLSKLPEGDVIYTHEDLMDESVFEFYNDREPEDCTCKKVPVEGMPFDEAYQVNLTVEPDYTHAYGLKAIGNGKDIKKDDVVLIALTLRNINANNDDNTCSVGIVYELAESPWTKEIMKTTSAGLRWSTVYYSFAAKADHKASDMKFTIRFGDGKPSTFEVADLKMINYGKKVSLSDMPMISYDTYEGIEDDAQWRKDADERIEKFRKGDMKFTVVDKNGNRVPDAKVSVNMTNHEFGLGTVLWNAPEYAYEGTEKYFEYLKQYFNLLCLGQTHKWEAYENNPEKAHAAAKWASENGFVSKGHTLVWDSWKHMPDDLEDLAYNGTYEEVAKRIEEHIRDICVDFDDCIYEWDVLNEPIANYFFRKKYGFEFVAKWFEWKDKYSPNSKNILNDTGIVGYETAKIEQLYEIIDNLQALGVHLDGLGIQGHFAITCNPETFYKQLDEISSRYDLPIKVTEFTHNADKIIQGYFTRDILTAVFSVERANGFIMWGAFEAYGSPSIPHQRVMFDKNWELKPAGEQIKYLMYDKWWTNNIGVTDSDGEYKTRGFYGDYEIVTESNGEKQIDIIRVLKGNDNEFTITLGSPVHDEKAQNKTQKKAVKELGDDAWEEVKIISFDRDDLSFVKSENVAKGISYDKEEKALKVKSTITDAKVTVDKIFDGLDLNVMTPYKITFNAKGTNGAVIYPSISNVTQDDGYVKINDVFNKNNSLNLTYNLEESYKSFTPEYYYIDGLKPTGISFTISGEHSDKNPCEITIDNIKVYKLKDDYVPR